MEFELDPIKSSANKIKNGIDFVEAQMLWVDDGRITIRAQSFGEPRFAVIARLDQKHWVAFFTLRGSFIRIISVRRARKMEKWHYDDHNFRRA